MLTLPGDEHPFPRSVRVMWIDDEYVFWLLDRDRGAPEGAVIRKEHCGNLGASVMLDSFLGQLVDGRPSESE